MGTTYQDFISSIREFKAFQKENSRCFNLDCKNLGIASHSLSKSQTLKRISGKVYSKQGVYSLDDEIDFDRDKKVVSTRIKTRKKLPFIGIGEASTFYGFCKDCDNVLFDSLDNYQYDFTKRSAFLYSYRTHSHFIARWLNQEDYLLNPAMEKVGLLKGELNNLNKQLQVVFTEAITDNLKNQLVGFEMFQAEIKPILEEISQSHLAQIKDNKLIYLELLGDLNNKTTFPLRLEELQVYLKQFSNYQILSYKKC